MQLLIKLCFSVLLTICYCKCDPIKRWKSYSNLVGGFSGAMSIYNSTSNIIKILSPTQPYGKLYIEYSLNLNQFREMKYPESNPLLQIQSTNDFVAINRDLYFVDIHPANNISVFNTLTSKWRMLHSLQYIDSDTPHMYSEPPCLTKSNDNKYIFILGGSNTQNEHDNIPLFDTFFIYDIQNNAIFNKKGPNLPYPSTHIGCILSSNNYLYIFGGSTIRNNGKHNEPNPSNEIWYMYVDQDINKIYNERWTKYHHILPYAPQRPYIGKINGLIYIIGGFDPMENECSRQTHYIQIPKNQSQNGRVYTGPMLPNALCYTAGIVSDYSIYLFGGQTHDNNGNPNMPKTWMKSNYVGPPTNAPTHTTVSPTQSPTYSPTSTPTESPTKSPSSVPTLLTVSPSPSSNSKTPGYWELFITSIMVFVCGIVVIVGYCVHKYRSAKKTGKEIWML